MEYDSCPSTSPKVLVQSTELHTQHLPVCTSSLRLPWTPLSPLTLPTCQDRTPIYLAEGATLCAPFHPNLGKSPSSTKRNHCKASERMNPTMMWPAGLMGSGCPQEQNPSRVLIVPQPLGAATSSHQHHQWYLQSPAMCLQLPKRHHQPQGRQEGSEDIPWTSQPQGFAMQCSLKHPLLPMAPEGSKTPTQSRRQLQPCLSVRRQHPRACLLTAMASNCSLTQRSHDF